MDRNLLSWLNSFFRASNNYLFIPAYLSILSLYLWIRNPNININNFDNLVQGIATFSNIDVNKRLSIFYYSILLIIIIFAISIIIIYFLDKNFRGLKHLAVPWNILSATGIGLIFIKLIKSGNDNIENLMPSLFITLFLYQVTKYLLKIKLIKSSGAGFIWLSALTLSFCFLTREILQIFNLLQNYQLPWLYVIVFTSILFFIIILNFLTEIKFAKIFIAVIPFFTLPIISVLSDEIYLILNQHGIHFLSPDIFYVILILICISVSIYLLFIKRKTGTLKYRQWSGSYIYPVMLAGIVFFTFYRQVIEQPADMFELANPANAIMRLYDFGELPILQALSSHTFSDFTCNLFYTFLNGYNGSVDFLLYDFIILVIFILFFYHFIRKIFNNNNFAFIFSLLFPFISIAVYGHHSFIFINILLCQSLFAAYSFRKLMFIALWSIFLVIWKIDVGFAAIISTLFILILYTLNNFNKKLIYDLLKVFAIISGGLIIIAIISYFATGADIAGNFLQAKEYFGANQAHGLTDVALQHDRYYQYHYFIFPVLLTFLLIYLVIKKRETTKKYSFIHLSLIFLTVYYIFQAQRGIVRHSMAEGSEMFMSTYFYLIFALFIFYILRKRSYAKLLFVISFILIVSNFKYPDCSGQKSILDEMCTVFSNSTHLKSSNQRIKRINGYCNFTNQNSSDLKIFMDNNFSTGATFIDMSNTPMLYFYTKRRVPSYFNQGIQNVVTEFLQKKYLENLKKFDVPVAIFSWEERSWNDFTDEVPNTIRYNLVTQYIYRNYEPYAIISKHYIWIKRSTEIKVSNNTIADSSFIFTPQNYNLMQYPYLLGKSSAIYKDTNNIAFWGKETILNIGKNQNYDKFENYLYLECKNDDLENIELTVKYYSDSTEIGSYKFSAIASAESHNYIVPLSSQYNWISMDISRLEIEKPQSIKIDNTCLFKKSNEH